MDGGELAARAAERAERPVKGAFQRTIHPRGGTKLLIHSRERASTPPIPESRATEQSSESKKGWCQPVDPS
jgi:hypothetical protein